MTLLSFRLQSLLLTLMLALPTLGARAALPTAVDGQPLPSLAPILERVLPALVNLSTVTQIATAEQPLLRDPFFRRFFAIPDRQRESQSLGSGVIIDAEQGIVLTNQHVVEQADAIRVTLHDGRRLDARSVGSDPETDIAVLQVPAQALRALTLADSDDLLVGDFVVAIEGRPVTSAADLRTRIGLLRAGSTLELELLREGNTRRLRAEIDDPYADFIPGARIDPILDGALLGEVERREGRRRSHFVAIGPLRPESPAWLSGLRESDLILNASRISVRSLRQPKAALSQASGLYELRLLRDGQLLLLSRR